jgi:hypothetical protein
MNTSTAVVKAARAAISGWHSSAQKAAIAIIAVIFRGAGATATPGAAVMGASLEILITDGKSV